MTTEVYDERTVRNADGLSGALLDMVAMANRDGETVYIGLEGDGVGNIRVRLVEETLTDGSTVFNILIGSAE